MTKIVVIGTGGHARSCLDVMLTAGLDVLGAVGDPVSGADGGRLQIPVLGGDEILPALLRQGHRTAFVAVGANRVRARITAQMQAQGWEFATVIAPSAHVAATSTVGPGSIVISGAVVGPYSTIGAGVIINTMASVDHDCVLGDFAHVAPGTHLAGTVSVGTGAFLGVGVSVIPGSTIGSWATVGAGGTVIGDVEDESTVVGVPARSKER
ncbi:acetyltransferase [Nakamurella sp. A5-74]|uniref:Acetyltransferase n=1 Tax=Nakamurella sp. A5-74 TaxID=3158264 RepID=A0AAU8DLI6_9ACTN